LARLRTDDVVRRQRALWLGPPGRRWPFDATYVAWLTGIASVVVCTSALAGVLTLLGGLSVGIPFGLVFGPVAGIALTRKLMVLVNHDRPLRYWRSIVRSELSPDKCDVTWSVSAKPAYRLYRRRNLS
jgi:hypothetical protein